MVVSDEKKPNIIIINHTATTTDHLQQGGGGVAMKNRRALSLINNNNHGSNNRPLQSALCEKDPPLHRPITRKNAAQNQLPEPEECKKLKATTTRNDFGTFIYIDAQHDDDDDDDDTNAPVPMSLDKTKVPKPNPIANPSNSIELLDHMFMEQEEEEVEMEEDMIDDEDEAITDIDAFDATNPLAAVDYVQHMYAYYKRMEGVSCVSPNYMAQQFDINEKMRAILIDWLIEVHDKFDLMSETLFLTVNVIDRFLSQQNVARKKLQLVGLVAMLLACKYEEVSVPIVGDLILISDKAYNRKDILETEKLMLNTLQFNMSVPTPYVFMQRFLKAAQADKKLEMLSFFLIELALVEYEMLKFPPSLLAASAIYSAQCALYGFKQWNRTCEWHSGYTENQLLECSRLIVGFHQSAATGKVTGVHRKYCTSKFGYIAKCEPALSLLGIRL